MAKLTKQAFIEAIKEMTLLEIKELLDGLKEEFGIDPSAVTVAGPAVAQEVEVAQEQTEFDVILVSFGPEKIKVIKVVKEATGLGLAESKTLTETPNAKVKGHLKKDEAQALKDKLVEAGATVEIK